MNHLNSEVLARLVDDAPDDEERRHLEECRACAAELRELRAQSEALGELPDLRPPPGDWEVLQARLVSEGLVRGGSRFGVAGLARTPGWMKVAAAVALFLAGGMAGAAVTTGPGGIADLAGSGNSGPFLPAASAETIDQAAERVRLAERQFMDALVQYRQLLETEGEPGNLPDPASRIAALEYLVQAGQAALREAPADPFLNGLLASTMAEREAALRRASTSESDNWF